MRPCLRKETVSKLQSLFQITESQNTQLQNLKTNALTSGATCESYISNW